MGTAWSLTATRSLGDGATTTREMELGGATATEMRSGGNGHGLHYGVKGEVEARKTTGETETETETEIKVGIDKEVDIKAIVMTTTVRGDEYQYLEDKKSVRRVRLFYSRMIPLSRAASSTGPW